MPTLRSIVRLASRREGQSPAATRQRDQRRSAFVSLVVAAATVLLLHVGLVVAAEYSLYLRDPVYSDKERKLAHIEQALPVGSPIVVLRRHVADRQRFRRRDCSGSTNRNTWTSGRCLQLRHARLRSGRASASCEALAGRWSSPGSTSTRNPRADVRGLPRWTLRDALLRRNHFRLG